MESQPVNRPTETVIPPEWIPDKHERYNRSDKGKKRARERDRTKSLERYMSRPFIAWDGEGINETDGSHTYVLLANSLGASLIERQGISTAQAFEFLLNTQVENAIHIGYGLGYDINMMLKDIDRETLQSLYDGETVRWNGYGIEWRPGKSLRLWTRDRKILLYDVLPFFQRSFVSACDEYLGGDWEARDMIIAEKKNRGNFSFDQITKVSEYNGAEVRNLVRLATELRGRLDRVDIHVSRWDGPGAIASSLYKTYNTKSHMGSVPTRVSEAGRYAYAGGRFELLRKGHRNAPVWQYDINSAYPHAIRYLPCLAHGEWKHIINPTSIARFGIYRIEVTERRKHPSQPQPLWHRNKDGTVYFSEYPHGWYWSPEARIGLETGGITIHEGWEYIPGCNCEPFAFIEALYNKRAALKKAKDGAHVGIKLGLNSLYGKLAQQIGWEPGPPLKLPPYHCLEWAGWVTSHCRAQLYRASLEASDDIIAFETDAIFSRVPLSVPLSGRLGEWEETKYDSITYLKSGMYWATQEGQEVEKSRGINKGSISRNDVILALSGDSDYPMVLNAEQTRFVTLGQALHQDFTKWRRWITGPRFLAIGLNGKRIDSLADPHKDIRDGLTETQEGLYDTSESQPYHVEWIDGPLTAPDGMTVTRLRQLDEEISFGMDYE